MHRWYGREEGSEELALEAARVDDKQRFYQDRALSLLPEEDIETLEAATHYMFRRNPSFMNVHGGLYPVMRNFAHGNWIIHNPQNPRYLEMQNIQDKVKAIKEGLEY